MTEERSKRREFLPLVFIVNYYIKIILFSIYKLSDLGVLSNLIGSLSRGIQQYSLRSEWIMRNFEDRKKMTGVNSLFCQSFRLRNFENRSQY